MQPSAANSLPPSYDVIKNRFRVVRWNDEVHASVTPRKGDYNNPPKGAVRIDDAGKAAGPVP
jgi:hypothetical protein